jgi:hypothetical protein
MARGRRNRYPKSGRCRLALRVQGQPLPIAPNRCLAVSDRARHSCHGGRVGCSGEVEEGIQKAAGLDFFTKQKARKRYAVIHINPANCGGQLKYIGTMA